MAHIRYITPHLADSKSHRVLLFGSGEVNSVLDNIFGFFIDVIELKGKDTIVDTIVGGLGGG